MVFPFNMPAIIELGTATGFDFELIPGGLGRRSDPGAQSTAGHGETASGSAGSGTPNGLEDTPQFKLDVDQETQALGVSLSDINETISAALGGYYVNDFIDRGRVKKCTFRLMPTSVCCRATLTTCMFVAPTAKWCRSPPLSLHAGYMARRAWSATTGCHLWRSSGEASPGKSTGKPWR
jgi:multidrug efflux pump subunit AcrB